MITDPNDHAFARPCTLDPRGELNFDSQDGLTKRELFAAMAMQAIVGCPQHWGGGFGQRARDAVKQADALIAELSGAEPDMRLERAITWLRRIEKDFPGSINPGAIDKHLAGPSA